MPPPSDEPDHHIDGFLAEPGPATLGDRVEIKSILVPPPIASGFHKLSNGDDFGGALLSLTSLVGGAHHVYGSAFLVGPGIALTADHTIREWQEARHFEAPEHAMFAVGTSGDALRIWQIPRMHRPKRGDVAILILAPRFEVARTVEITVFELSARLPPEGSPVTALGFRAASEDGTFPTNLAENDLGAVGKTGLVAVGPVLDVYLQGTPNLPGPTIGVQLATVGGMSGGPVFDADGRVVGVVSSSLESAVFEECVTFASLIWPALFFPLEPEWPAGFIAKHTTLLDVGVHEGWRLARADEGLAYRHALEPGFTLPRRS